jgi:hypothetical protein
MAVDVNWNEELEEILRNILSEENTDKLIDVLMDKINFPWWLPSGIIRKTLDQMLPDVLLNAILEMIPND